MKIFAPLTVTAATALGFSAVDANLPSFRASLGQRQLTASTFPAGLNEITNTDLYHMKPVHVVQARVQGDKPEWNAELNAFVSKYGNDNAMKFRGAMDSVNTASVEGALMYVQAEGINYATRGSDDAARCTRKYGMNYVVFYEMLIAQTNETLAQYTDSEYGPYVAIDGAQCTPTNGTGDAAIFSDGCNQLGGTNGQPDLGLFVGAGDRSTEGRAPYPNAYWFSFPNTCPLKFRSDKTDVCRAKSRGGLCAFDTKPDGVTCTYNYRILGWVPIDDLVGITDMNNKNTTGKYASFSQFCMDGRVEFNATADKGEWIASIDFWKHPQDSTANAARATKLIELYASASTKPKKLTQVTDDDLAHFKDLPTIASLRTANPKCYENVKACANAEFGCKRDLYGQLCTVCEAASPDCAVAPDDFSFPALVKVTPAPPPAAPMPSPTSEEPTPAPTPATTKPTSAASAVSLLTAASIVAPLALSFVMA